MSETAYEALARVFAATRVALRRRLRRLLPPSSDAEDVVQEAFLRAVEKADEVNVPEAFLYTAARNVAIDEGRRAKRARSLVHGAQDVFDAGPVVSLEEQLLAEEKARLFGRALQRLPHRRRAAFAMKMYEGCSYKEIASVLGLSEKTVENHIARALRDTHEYVSKAYGSKGPNHG